MQRWMGVFDTKGFSALLLGAVALATFGLMDNDWHVVALTLLTMGTYWLSFRVS